MKIHFSHDVFAGTSLTYWSYNTLSEFDLNFTGGLETKKTNSNPSECVFHIPTLNCTHNMYHFSTLGIVLVCSYRIKNLHPVIEHLKYLQPDNLLLSAVLEVCLAKCQNQYMEKKWTVAQRTSCDTQCQETNWEEIVITTYYHISTSMYQ